MHGFGHNYLEFQSHPLAHTVELISKMSLHSATLTRSAEIPVSSFVHHHWDGSSRSILTAAVLLRLSQSSEFARSLCYCHSEDENRPITSRNPLPCALPAFSPALGVVVAPSLDLMFSHDFNSKLRIHCLFRTSIQHLSLSPRSSGLITLKSFLYIVWLSPFLGQATLSTDIRLCGFLIQRCDNVTHHVCDRPRQTCWCWTQEMSFVANGLLGTLPSTLPSLAEVPCFAPNGLLGATNSELQLLGGSGDNFEVATQQRGLIYFSSISQVQ